MEELDPKSYKLLKRLGKEADWVKVSDCREIRELLDKKFVDAEKDIDIEPFNFIYKTERYIINDSGDTYILNHKQATWQWWIPIIMSGLALAISIIALLKP